METSKQSQIEPREMHPTRPADGTVGKALDVLDQVAIFGRPVRFAELLQGSHYPKATLYRFLQTLTNQKMLSYNPDNQTYSLGARLVRLAHHAWRQASLAPLARPHLDRLSQKVELTTHLAQLDGGQVLYVDKRNASKPLSLFSQTGKIGPAYCTGVGKVMLAFVKEPILSQILSMQSFHPFTPNTVVSEDSLRAELQTIRERGYAFDNEEHEPNIICIAAPILTIEKRLMGAISLTTTAQKSTLSDLEALAPTLLDTAGKIATEAEHWHFPDM